MVRRVICLLSFCLAVLCVAHSPAHAGEDEGRIQAAREQVAVLKAAGAGTARGGQPRRVLLRQRSAPSSCTQRSAPT